MWSLVVFALYLTSVYANAIPSKSILITYDDIESNPVAAQADPIPEPYNGLVSGRFNARANGLSILRSVSGNNTAGSNELNNILAGQTPNITSEYDKSPVEYYDLKSTVYNPVQGDNHGKKTVSALCTYDAKQRQVEFCDFQGKLDGVTYVSVVPTDSETLPDTTVEYLDNTLVVEHYYQGS